MKNEISDKEGMKRFLRLKEKIAKRNDEKLEKDIEIFQIHERDKDIKEKLKKLFVFI